MQTAFISDIQCLSPFIVCVIYHGSYQPFCHLLYISFFLASISMSYTLVPLGTLSSLWNVSRSPFILGSVLIFCVWVCVSTCSRWIILRLETQWPNEECQGNSETVKGFVWGWKTTGMINMWCESAADPVAMIIGSTFAHSFSQVLHIVYLHIYQIYT